MRPDTRRQSYLDAIEQSACKRGGVHTRLFGIASAETDPDKIDSGLYSIEATEQTYARLLELTSLTIGAGYSVIVDAAFLSYEQRDLFRTLAESLNVHYKILSTSAPAEVLRKRIAERKIDVSDADIIVLDHQLSSWQPLHEDEARFTISVDTGDVLDKDALLSAINSK